MNTQTEQGEFEVIDSFAIKRRNEFYMIGEIKKGTMQVNWFVNVTLNLGLSLSLRISEIETVEFSEEKKDYKLIIISADEETINILLSLKIGIELVKISIEGKD
ncbi:hypothetical protein [Psychroserpens algicola]|uniref:hypothetical protein n=1 Tax=Psychroserpens algicola TaxID=1719034 RepID=UPI001953B744|nr:hypothetical protein [Psychroserpens algicola]